MAGGAISDASMRWDVILLPWGNMIERKAIVHFMEGPNVGHFDGGHFVPGAWAVVRYRCGGFLHWETFNTEDEALAAKDRWEKDGRI